jgi:hypothetical protein
MSNANNKMTSVTIARLSLACHYWEMARKSSRQGTADYYKKAYAIFLVEIGENNSSSLELRKEMNERLSNLSISNMVF